MTTKIESAKEICLKQYHADLAIKQQKLIEWDLPSRFAPLIGLDPEEMTDEIISILIGVGRGIAWSEPFHIMAQALADAVDADIEISRRNVPAEVGDALRQ